MCIDTLDAVLLMLLSLLGLELVQPLQNVVQQPPVFIPVNKMTQQITMLIYFHMEYRSEKHFKTIF